jgi:phosphoglycolate phosphatase-like HAD superfamily hydrolase
LNNYCDAKGDARQGRANVKLVIFDLDGTLTRTNQVDDLCFPRAFAESLGVSGLNTDWSAYPHATDTVIFEASFAQRFRRLPDSDESRSFRRHFVALLSELHASQPALFAEISGASIFLDRLQRDPRWSIAIATGCWKQSAEFKMEAAGLPTAGLPMAFVEDGISREEIVQAAMDRAASHYKRQFFERVVSVGDGLWDVKTAQKLGLPFVGVAEGERAELLRQAGATHVLENFLDWTRCLTYFDEARIPVRN